LWRFVPHKVAVRGKGGRAVLTRAILRHCSHVAPCLAQSWSPIVHAYVGDAMGGHADSHVAHLV